MAAVWVSLRVRRLETPSIEACWRCFSSTRSGRRRCIFQVLARHRIVVATTTKKKTMKTCCLSCANCMLLWTTVSGIRRQVSNNGFRYCFTSCVREYQLWGSFSTEAPKPKSRQHPHNKAIPPKPWIWTVPALSKASCP